jgi:hypothetical protein
VEVSSGLAVGQAQITINQEPEAKCEGGSHQGCVNLPGADAVEGERSAMSLDPAGESRFLDGFGRWLNIASGADGLTIPEPDRLAGSCRLTRRIQNADHGDVGIERR